MFNMIRTLIRGRVADSADVLESSNALPILRQQLREAAEGVASGRRAVAVVMAYAERERKNAGQLRSQIGDVAIDGALGDTQLLAELACGTYPPTAEFKQQLEQAVAAAHPDLTSGQC